MTAPSAPDASGAADVDRLAQVIADAYNRGVPPGSRFGPDAAAIAREVLEQYIVVPRDGAEERTQYAQSWRGQVMPLHAASAVLGTETHRRRVIVGAWEEIA